MFRNLTPYTRHLTTSLSLLILFTSRVSAQTNLLLNGGFEDINTCTEYKAECGVEAWFYLKDVKAQMLLNEEYISLVGHNSFGIFYTWAGYTGFTPVIGAILPCRLQKDLRYTFKGMMKASLNSRLSLKPGIALGPKFYVPKRPFSTGMNPDSIVQINPVLKTGYFRFEFSFVADGTERYLTFGTFIEEDTVPGKRTFLGTQSISLILDNFELVPADRNETACTDLAKNKEIIYDYNFRHKEMDYSLYGKGELDIRFNETDSNYFTRRLIPPPPLPPATDTLKLGDVFFDFNKADLKPEALKMLAAFFQPGSQRVSIDSIYVEGHTDSIGSDTRNLQLSLQRCKSIESWLLQNKVVSKDLIQVHPFGKTRPIATNRTPQGRALNRRVEMINFRKL